MRKSRSLHRSNLHSGIEILELGVPVRMIAALTRFAIALHRVAEFAQQLGDDCVSAWNKAPVSGVIGVQTGPL
jgi:hypothetical protein